MIHIEGDISVTIQKKKKLKQKYELMTEINSTSSVFLICCHCCQQLDSTALNLHQMSHVQDKYSLWDGVLSSLDLAEELLRYAVIKGELAVQHGEEDHTKSPHVTRFTAVRSTWRQDVEEIKISEIHKCGIWNGNSKVLQCLLCVTLWQFMPWVTQGWSTF